MPHASFVHLRVRSAFSLLEGAVRHGDLAKRCRKEEMPAVAITDRASLFGAMQFCDAVKKVGVQPILGALMPIRIEAPKHQTRLQGRTPDPLPMPILVKDESGWNNLLKLMSVAYLTGEPGQLPQVSIEDLLARSEGLIVLTGGPAGPMGDLLTRGDHTAAEQLLLALKRGFGDRLYVELMRHGLEAEEATEEAFVELAFRHDVPMVATNDVHFVDLDMHEAHDVLLCIAQGRQLSEQDRPRLTVEHRFKTAAEMRELFADLPEAVDNTLVIAQRCAFTAPARKPILPTFAEDEEAEMRRQSAAGLERRLLDFVLRPDMTHEEMTAAAEPYRTRLAYELDVIAQMKFSGYFLIVSDFIKWAKSQSIPVGPGRGSGAGSVVAWSLEITDLDPLRFGLLFERFLNPERVSMPDFDIDFCEERRGEVMAYVRDRYGADRVAQIITFGTLQARAALRDVGRVLGLPFGLVDRTCKLVPNNPANPVTLAQAIEAEPRLKQSMAEDESVARMVEIALKLEGSPRNASTHAAGVVIGDRPLDELVPLYRDPRALMPATQFNMKDVEKAGLVKFDFLGLSTLTLLTMAEKEVTTPERPFKLMALPLDDKPTYELLGRGETTGVFQLESGGMRDALRKLKPDRFEDIIAMNALYRPGPMENIPRYTNVKHGTEAAQYLHPLLEPILAETNGVIIYQEQVMELAQKLAGYTLGGADLLRRAMGKKIKSEMDAQREIFVKGAMERGIDQGLADTIFDAVAKFASYGFNKSHAAAYALLAYQTAYLKANHAPEFYASAMTTEMANQDKLAAFRQEMSNRGVQLLPPDVNRSGVRFLVEVHEGTPAVRYALPAIKGVGQQAVEALLAERDARGSFTDLFDLVRRVGAKSLNRRLLEALIKAGALDDLDLKYGNVSPNRQQMIVAIDAALRWAQTCSEVAQSGQCSLFDSTEGRLPPRPKVPPVAYWPTLQQLQMELEVVGFYISAHPLDGYRQALAKLGVVAAADLRSRLDEGARPVSLYVSGVPLARQERSGDRGRFAFAQLSDPTGQFEVTLYSEILGQSRDILDAHTPVLIEGSARLDGDNVKIVANRIEPLADRVDRAGATVVEIVVDDLQTALELKQVFQAGERGARVKLIIAHRGEEITLILPPDHVIGYGRRADVARLRGVRALRDPDQNAA